MTFYTVKQIAEKYPAFSESQLWRFIRDERTGFSKCVIRLETVRRVSIYESAFLKWIKDQNPHCKDIVTDEDELNRLGENFTGVYCEHCYRRCNCK